MYVESRSHVRWREDPGKVRPTQNEGLITVDTGMFPSLSASINRFYALPYIVPLACAGEHDSDLDIGFPLVKTQVTRLLYLLTIRRFMRQGEASLMEIRIAKHHDDRASESRV